MLQTFAYIVVAGLVSLAVTFVPAVFAQAAGGRDVAFARCVARGAKMSAFDDTPSMTPATPAPSLAEQVAQVPTQPGCYLWKDASGEVIYVGKAKNLRSRMRQYVTLSTSGRRFRS